MRTLPANEMDGKEAARAAPMSALEAPSCASAARASVPRRTATSYRTEGPQVEVCRKPVIQAARKGGVTPRAGLSAA